MTKIKLWVSDIDGTLMNYDSSYTPEMEKLISKINNSQCKLVLATKSAPINILPVAKTSLQSEALILEINCAIFDVYEPS